MGRRVLLWTWPSCLLPFGSLGSVPGLGPSSGNLELVLGLLLFPLLCGLILGTCPSSLWPSSGNLELDLVLSFRTFIIPSSYFGALLVALWDFS